LALISSSATIQNRKSILRARSASYIAAYDAQSVPLMTAYTMIRPVMPGANQRTASPHANMPGRPNPSRRLQNLVEISLEDSLLALRRLFWLRNAKRPPDEMGWPRGIESGC
jgi:hypothetical protein